MSEDDDDPGDDFLKDPRSGTYEGWAAAFTIFAKYSGKDGHIDSTAAEHDAVYAGPDPEIVSAEDKLALLRLGWCKDDETICFRKFT